MHYFQLKIGPKYPKMLPTDAIFKLEIQQIAFADGASPQTSLGELTALSLAP